MSSDNTRDPKRSGLAGQIEVEVIRDPQSTGINNLLASSSSSNPLRMLQELVEQMEELEQASTQASRERLSPAQVQRYLARFQKQDSALKRKLDKAH
jgi:hypothetical protein